MLLVPFTHSDPINTFKICVKYVFFLNPYIKMCVPQGLSSVVEAELSSLWMKSYGVTI